MIFKMPAKVVVFLGLLLVLASRAPLLRSATEALPLGVYDANPDHLWNRVYRQFYLRRTPDGREYGVDELDPLLWGETKYLRSGPSHRRAIQLLDEFLTTHGERLITDPVKRAVLQRDLWAIFDWLSAGNSEQPVDEEFLRKTATVLESVALAPSQIESLPDNYAAAIESKAYPVQFDPRRPDVAFLPPDLFEPRGPWVCLGTKAGPGAPAHTGFFERSVFLVFLRLPEGRQAALNYLKQISGFPHRLIPNPGGFYPIIRHGATGAGPAPDALVPNPNLPQFPTGTQVALVRQMMLISSRGDLVPSRLTESVQIRVFRDVPSRADWLAGHYNKLQDVFEFRLSRPRLFGGEAGGLRAVASGERGFSQFLTMPMDPLELHLVPPQPRLESCQGCHGAPGIHSLLGPRTIWAGEDAVELLSSSAPDQTASAVVRKQHQPNWKRLKEFWK
jgi:hypothetical protein